MQSSLTLRVYNARVSSNVPLGGGKALLSLDGAGTVGGIVNVDLAQAILDEVHLFHGNIQDSADVAFCGPPTPEEPYPCLALRRRLRRDKFMGTSCASVVKRTVPGK